MDPKPNNPTSKKARRQQKHQGSNIKENNPEQHHSASEEEFEADIKVPEELPLPKSELGHHRVQIPVAPIEESEKIVDAEFAKVAAEIKGNQCVESKTSTKTTSAEKTVTHSKERKGKPVNKITHDAVHRNVDSIVSLGPVEKEEAFSHMQDFQKELLVEGSQASGNKEPLSDIGIKSIGPVDTACEEFTHGFQKSLTLGGAWLPPRQVLSARPEGPSMSYQEIYRSL